MRLADKVTCEKRRKNLFNWKKVINFVVVKQVNHNFD